MGTAQTLVIHGTAGYVARPIFRSLIVAQTGRKKTPAQKAILKPVITLEESAMQDYQHEQNTYEADLREWKQRERRGDDPGPEPVKPSRKRYMTQDSTLAARIQIHKENPRGLLLYKDEGSGFITERGRFTSGKGDGGEFEADLSEFNGDAIMCDRKTDGNTFIPKSNICRVGATQFSTLQRLMGEHSDDCGEYARYLFCAAPAPPSKIDLSTDIGDVGLTSDVMRLFTQLYEMPEGTYLLSPEAKQAFQTFQHELTDRQIAEDHPSLQSAYPKFETYFGRFILWLHLVNAVLANSTPEPVVTAHTVELARQWTEYFVGQLKLILALNSPQQELTGDALQVYEYVKRKEQLDIRGLVQGRLFSRATDKSKAKTPYMRELLSALVEQRWLQEQDGLYSIAPAHAVEQSVEQNVEQVAQQIPDVEQNVEQMLSSNNPAQQLTGQRLQGSVEQNVEQLSRFPNRENQTPIGTLNRHNGNGNGHHPTQDQFEPLTDEEYSALYGGDDDV